MEAAGGGAGSVRVCVRIRPQSDAEAQTSGQIAVRAVDRHVLVFDPDEPEEPSFFHGKRLKARDPTVRKPRDLKFAFDRVFDESGSNREVYEETTKGLLNALLSGYNCSVFAYGATGSGKTFTMLGKPSMPGVIFHMMMDLYSAIDGRKTEACYDVAISYMEVYNEQVKDLLAPSSQCLPLREDPQRGVIVQGLSLHKPQTAEELLQMLDQGNKNRTQHPTDANAESSRSHAVFQVFVRQSDRGKGTQAAVNVGKMSLIDLAGSERATVSKNCGDRLREGANINRSLLALGNCINTLADQRHKGQHHVPYRDSKLTRILKDSLGGNCRTVMIAAVSPSRRSFDDTYNTLRYADRAKHIKAEVKQNVVNVDQHILKYTKIIEELTAEVTLLKSRLKKAEEDRSATAAVGCRSAVPAGGAAGVRPLPAVQDISKCREVLQQVFSERALAREALLAAESQQRGAQYMLLRKEAALSRLQAFDEGLGALRETTAESSSRIQQAICLAKRRECALAQQKREACVKVKANVDKLRQVLASDVSVYQDKPTKERLQEVLLGEHLKAALTDSRHHVKHLRRLMRTLDKENQGNDRLISVLLRALSQQASILEQHNLVSQELQETYEGLHALLATDRSVGFADEPECSSSDTLDAGGRDKFASLLDLPTYHWPLSVPTHGLLSVDPGNTSPSAPISRGRAVRSPALKRNVLSRYADDVACEADDTAASLSQKSGCTVGSSAPTATLADVCKIASATPAQHRTCELVPSTAWSPMDTDSQLTALGEMVVGDFPSNLPEHGLPESSPKALNETFSLDVPVGESGGGGGWASAAAGLSGKQPAWQHGAWPSTAAACRTEPCLAKALGEARAAAPKHCKTPSGESCSSAVRGATVQRPAPARPAAADAVAGEGRALHVLPRRVALAACNTPPPATGSASKRAATVSIAELPGPIDGLSSDAKSPAPARVLARAAVLLRGEEENQDGGGHAGTIALRRPMKRPYGGDPKPGYMQMTHAASRKKARLEAAASSRANSTYSTRAAGSSGSSGGDSVGLPRVLR